MSRNEHIKFTKFPKHFLIQINEKKIVLFHMNIILSYYFYTDKNYVHTLYKRHFFTKNIIKCIVW